MAQRAVRTAGGVNFGGSASIIGVTPSSSGVLSGFAGNGGVFAFTTPVFLCQNGGTISTSLRLETSNVAGESFGGGPGTVAAVSNFGTTAGFITSGPLFNLPAGFTVNSADGLIVDNQFGAPPPVPEPGTLLLFGSGATILGGVVRKRRRGARQAATLA